MRVYLATLTAGMRENDLQKIIEVGKPKYLLNTFYEGEKACKKVFKIAGNADNFLLDSGAFSYMSGAKCSEKQIEEYAEQYVAFIKENKITQYIEMDVDTIFGLPFVEKIRKRAERETGIQSIPVWHKNRGVEYWKRMCEEYKYVAIGGLVFHVKKQELPYIKKMVDFAREKGVKVHGLGFTKTKELENWNWYSVDSSSWKTAAIRGSMKHYFDGKTIQTQRIDGDGYKVDQRLLAANNAVEWCKYQKHMELKRW